jgi:hypothetical protein
MTTDDHHEHEQDEQDGPVRDYRLPEPGAIDLGHDVHVTFLAWRDHERAGLHIYHRRPDGQPCVGAVMFDLPGVTDVHRGAVWQVVSLDPIHIDPSVLCSCGSHGWIHAGRWVPA